MSLLLLLQLLVDLANTRGTHMLWLAGHHQRAPGQAARRASLSNTDAIVSAVVRGRRGVGHHLAWGRKGRVVQLQIEKDRGTAASCGLRRGTVV